LELWRLDVLSFVRRGSSRFFPFSTLFVHIILPWRFVGFSRYQTLLHVELSFRKLPFPGLLILDPKKYSVSKRRVVHRRTGTEVTCFRQIPKASQVRIEGFAIFLVPLIRFCVHTFIQPVKYSSNLEINRVHIVGISTFGILEWLKISRAP